MTALATGLDHPRWLYVLPNGDVLVAETNAPPRPEDGQRASRAGSSDWCMEKAGAAVPSANRITLLRDADGDGVAETRTVFLKDLNSPFGMALVGSDFYVANTDAVVRFPYAGGRDRDHGAGREGRRPAGRAAQPPLDQEPDRQSATASELYVTVGSNSNVAENGMDARRSGAPAILGGRSRDAARTACSPRGCATPTAWLANRRPARCGRWSTSATSWAATSCRTT